MAVAVSHAECKKTWTGSTAAHCSGCHETYSSVALFDAHRVGYGERGSCKPPGSIRYDGQRLRLDQGVWKPPEMPVAARQRLRAA